MRKSIISIMALSILALMFTGCAPSMRLSKLPPIGEGIIPAKVYIIRPHMFVGDGLKGFIYLDDTPVFRIAAGDYTMLQVSPGNHTIRIMGKGWVDIVMNQVSISCLSGESYYFKVTNNKILRVAEEAGNKFIAKCQYVPLDTQD